MRQDDHPVPFATRVCIGIAVLALVAAGIYGTGRSPQRKAENHFQYCLGAASPASAEAITACREAAKSIAKEK